MSFRILADENVDGQIVRALASHDVLWVARAYPSILDPQVMDLCLQTNRTLVTADKLLAERFARSVEHAHLGLIFLRLAEMPEDAKTKRLLDCLHGKTSLAYAHLVIKKRSMRELTLPLVD